MVNSSVSKSPSTPTAPSLQQPKANPIEKTTSGKKMKQTRLPFATKGGAGENDVARKRKLSSPETDEVPSVKIVRREGDTHTTSVGQSTFTLINEDEELVEIIPCDDSNSAAAAPTVDNEETVDQVEIVEEVEEEGVESAEKSEEQEDGPELLNESTNIDGNTSGSNSDDAEKPALDSSLAAVLEPPVNPNGKPLTPRQLEKFVEKKKRHEERLRQKVERERKLEEEKRQREERERLKKKEREEREELKRKEKEDKEAARLKEKEEKEAARLKEKEDRDRKKQQELEQRNEEKRRREEQREEERRKKDEEKRKKEVEEELKKKKAAQAFTKFFKVGAKGEEEKGGGQLLSTSSAVAAVEDEEVVVNSNFMPFEVKGDMKLAPLVRKIFDGKAKGALDKVLQGGGVESVQGLYLRSLKSKGYVPLKGTKTWISSESSDESEDDLMVVGDDEVAHKVEEVKQKQKYRAKYLMFKENRRPAYYGTWQKQSKTVGPRTPFGKDEKYFDYDVDSDEEWDEEEPGESLHGSDDEKDKESEDDYEVDNDFFVPHGHLSDEEMQNADEEDNSPEAQKVKLKLLQDEFNDEMKKKTEKIKPRLIGCIWVNEAGGKPDNCPNVFWELLQFRKVITAGPIVLRPPVNEEEKDGGDEDNMADAEDEVDKPGRKGHSLPEDEIRDLIRLVHGNLNRGNFMVKEFQMFREKGKAPESMRVVTNMSILRKIKEIAKWETPPTYSSCWVVQKDILEQYEMADLPLVNKWEYALTPKRTHECLKVSEKKKEQQLPNSPQVPTQQVATVEAPKTPVLVSQEKVSPPSANKQKPQNSIARFAKVLTTEEKQKQFQSINISSPKANLVPNSIANENKAPPPPPAVVKLAGVPSVQQSSQPVAKKRVPLLMSVPRGQAISEQSKSLLIKNFLEKRPDTAGHDVKTATTPISDGDKGKEGSTEPTIVPVETIVLD